MVPALLYILKLWEHLILMYYPFENICNAGHRPQSSSCWRLSSCTQHQGLKQLRITFQWTAAFCKLPSSRDPSCQLPIFNSRDEVGEEELWLHDSLMIGIKLEHRQNIIRGGGGGAGDGLQGSKVYTFQSLNQPSVQAAQWVIEIWYHALTIKCRGLSRTFCRLRTHMDLTD